MLLKMALIPVQSRLYHIFLLVFPDLGTLNIWGQITVYLSLGGCPVYCRIFNNTPGVYPPDSSTPQA